MRYLVIILVLLSVFITPQIHAASVDYKRACLNAKGSFDEREKECKCGTAHLAANYEYCDKDRVLPAHIQQIREIETAAKPKAIIDGHQYIWLYKPLLVQFESKKICYGELSVERVNDTRVLPGGTVGGGSMACHAVDDSCPSIESCLRELHDPAVRAELLLKIGEIGYVYSHFGPFTGHAQLLEDQDRGSFTCYHPQTQQTKIFNLPTQHYACTKCMFWGRDEAKVDRPYGCSHCDSPDAMKGGTPRACSADGI